MTRRTTWCDCKPVKPARPVLLGANIGSRRLTLFPCAPYNLFVHTLNMELWVITTLELWREELGVVDPCALAAQA